MTGGGFESTRGERFFSFFLFFFHLFVYLGLNYAYTCILLRMMDIVVGVRVFFFSECVNSEGECIEYWSVTFLFFSSFFVFVPLRIP